MNCVQQNIRYTIIVEKKEGVCNRHLLISPGLSRLWWEYLFTKSFGQQTGTLANLRLLYRFQWFGYPLVR